MEWRAPFAQMRLCTVDIIGHDIGNRCDRVTLFPIRRFTQVGRGGVVPAIASSTMHRELMHQSRGKHYLL